MGISQDSSTPSFSSTTGGTNLGADFSSGTGTLTSASFSPPANSLVAVMVMGGYNSEQSYTSTGLTVADSLSNSYTSGVSLPVGSWAGSLGWSGMAIFWNYYTSAPGSITVKATLASAEVASTGTAIDLVALVLDGCASSQSGAASATNSANSGTAETVAITTTTTGSWVLVMAMDGLGAKQTAASNTTILDGVAADAAGNTPVWGKATNATVTPGAITVGFTAASTLGSNDAGIVALEILPSSNSVAVTASLTGAGSFADGLGNDAVQPEIGASGLARGSGSAGSGAGLGIGTGLSGSGSASSGVTIRAAVTAAGQGSLTAPVVSAPANETGDLEGQGQAVPQPAIGVLGQIGAF